MPEPKRIGATALNFSVQIILVDRIVVTSRVPQTELHYPDHKFCIKHSKMHILTDKEASRDRLNIKTNAYPLTTISKVSETCKTSSKPNILHYCHNSTTISAAYQLHRQILLASSTNTCTLRAKLKCKYSQHQSKTRGSLKILYTFIININQESE